jgi:NADPH-dependent 2,4-dienoyl-CoA reductase/sulfur reductase-like enzyme
VKHLSADVLVIGSGPAGLAAAYQARQDGAGQVLVIERNNELGGILPQCIHNGFGVRVFQSDLTGPEYAGRWIRRAHELDVDFLPNTMVLETDRSLRVVATNSELGLVEVKAKALVLAMGCRERPRGALAIPGTRPAGVYTAGTAQRMVNMEGYMPGSRFVILGSGDIGMIMARRLTIEGAQVVSMLEILPYISGLKRNLVQCLHDFDIPLSLRTTVTEVRGRERVESVIASSVDEHWQVIPDTQRELICDTLLFSVGLIPENELSRMAGVSIDPITGGPYVDERYATNVPGIYAAGNVVHVYDVVDDVTESALCAGHYAANYAQHGAPGFSRAIPIVAGENVHHVVPHSIHHESLNEQPPLLQFRVRRPIEESVRAQVSIGDEVLISKRLRYVRPSEMITLELDPALASRLAQAEKQRETLQVGIEQKEKDKASSA